MYVKPNCVDDHDFARFCFGNEGIRCLWCGVDYYAFQERQAAKEDVRRPETSPDSEAMGQKIRD